jgi:SAM-dependent methyltransferase
VTDVKALESAAVTVRGLVHTLAGTKVVAGARIRAMVGDRVECPCCGARFRRFRGFNGPDRLCWSCGALERHRALWLFFDAHPELLKPGLRILHVAPEAVLRDRFRALPDVHYVGGDLTAEYGPERIDVTQLQFADASFDAVVCNHVLEHVPDDARAMREIHRVLAPSGWAILQVPDVAAEETDEDAAVTSPDDRQRRFGQWDHVRRYGWDYVDRLRAAAFAVDVVRLERELDEGVVERCRLRKYGEVEPIFVCRPERVR